MLNGALGAVMDGLRFTQVREDGVAAKAGIREGDVLKSVSGQVVEDVTSILTILVERSAELNLVLQRGDTEVAVKIDPASLLGRRGRRGGR